MELIDERTRAKSIRFLFWAVWVCLAADLLFFAYYMISDTLRSTVIRYIVTRCFLPFAVNLASFAAAALTNRSKLGSSVKNSVCAFSLCTLAGSMGFFHGWFVPLWCGPAIALIYSSIFHDKKLQNMMLVYCFLLIAAECSYTVCEHPENPVGEYIQNAVVVAAMTVIFRVVGGIMARHSDDITAMNTEALRKEQEYLRQLSFDDLTRVYSRPYLVSRAKALLSEGAKQEGCDITLAILDVDLFKSVNDTYGHENGDEVLRTLGAVLGRLNDEGMTAGRYGGEEFVIMLCGEAHSGNMAVLEELRREFESKKYWFTDKSFTFSCGAVKCEKGDDFDIMLAKADTALYKAKNSGRNRLTEFTGEQ